MYSAPKGKCPRAASRRGKVWSMQLGGGDFVEGASWAGRPSCSGSPSTPVAEARSREAGHRSPLRVCACEQRQGLVTLSSTAPSEAGGQQSPAFRVRKSGLWSQAHARKGRQEPGGPPASSKDTGRKGQQTPWGLYFSFLFLCLPPTAHRGLAM